MLRNFFLTALRQLRRNPFYNALNLTGLTIGVSCCLMIATFIRYELSFDQFHANKILLYRVNYDVTMGGNQITSPSVPVFVARELKSWFPEIEDATRFSEGQERTVRYGTKFFDEGGFCWVDSNFFRIFSFKALQGDPGSALNKPNTLVIAESIAKKYFGNEDPIGKVLTINNTRDYEVAAIVADVPANSTFHFNMATSIYSIKDLDESVRWDNPDYATFLLLQPNVDKLALEKKIEDWVNPPTESSSQRANIHLPIEPLSGIHFNTQVFNYAGRLAITDFKYLIIFGVVAFLILLIACINYINLATSRATTRAKEVGMRKAIGASFSQLILQFLAESFLMLLPAILLSIMIVWIVLPIVNDVLGKQITFDPLEPGSILIVGLSWILLSSLAGFYPAFVLAKFKPISVLKGNPTLPSSPLNLRKGLVVFQFAISTVLIAGTLIILGQLNFMQSTRLGLDREHVFILKGNAELRSMLPVFADKVRSIAGVKDVALAWRSPFKTVTGNGLALTANPGEGTEWVTVGAIAGDEHYLSTMGMELVKGRNFTPRTSDKMPQEFIVNENFLAEFGVSEDEIIGKQVTLGMLSAGTIVGVVKDFHTASLNTKVKPVCIFNESSWFGTLIIRAEGNSMQDVLTRLETEWKTLMPQRPFAYTFLDEEYDSLYKSETQVGQLITFSAFLAILIACFGLLGLSSYTAIQRSREIGIRKVLGATTQSLVMLFSRGYIRLLVVSFALAVPLGYYLMSQWLEGFAYRITINPLYFVAAIVSVTAIAWFTVSYHTLRASMANPAETLKCE
jgi:putative ABC transport system permease protein